MATYYASITIAIRFAEIPKGLASFGEAVDLYQDENSHRCVSGYSRRNWFQFMIEKTIEVNNLKSLDYFKFQTSILNSEEIMQAISDLERMLCIFKLNPANLISLSGQTIFSEKDIISFVDAPKISLNPALASEGGDDLAYFIAFLKAHLFILTAARNEKLSIVYSQSA